MDNQYRLSIPYIVVMDEVDGGKERGEQGKQSLSENETGAEDREKMITDQCTSTLNPRD